MKKCTYFGFNLKKKRIYKDQYCKKKGLSKLPNFDKLVNKKKIYSSMSDT